MAKGSVGQSTSMIGVKMLKDEKRSGHLLIKFPEKYDNQTWTEYVQQHWPSDYQKYIKHFKRYRTVPTKLKGPFKKVIQNFYEELECVS